MILRITFSIFSFAFCLAICCLLSVFISPSLAQTKVEVKGENFYINEDDHFDFDKDWNNCIAAVSSDDSWGFFDFRMKDEGFEQGYQSVPVDWSIRSERKKAFFKLLREITRY